MVKPLLEAGALTDKILPFTDFYFFTEHADRTFGVNTYQTWKENQEIPEI